MKSEATQCVNASKISKFEYLRKCLTKQESVILISTSVVLLMVLVVLTIQYNNGFPNNCQLPSNISVRKVTDGGHFCNCNSSGITCSGAVSITQIEDDMYNFQDCLSSHLMIIHSTFPKIPSFFLREYRHTIVSLTITSSSFMEIENDAFNSAAFTNLKEVTLRMNSNLRYLREHAFKGPYAFNNFSLEMDAHTHIIFEKNFLQHMNTITSLQLHRCILTEEHLANITSSDVYLMSLQIVDFRFNSIRTINAGAFAKLRSAVSLYLGSSEIEEIQPGAFDGLIALRLLSLPMNILSTLPENVFGSHVTTVNLINNIWHCDCNLQWLKDLYMNKNVLSKPLTCEKPSNKEFSEVVFCTEGESSTTLTTTKSSATTTEDAGSETTAETTEVSTTTIQEETPKRYKEIICRDWARSPLDIPDFGDLVYNQTVKTAYENLHFEFYDPDLEPVQLRVLITGNITGFHLLWFNSRNISETGCVTNMENAIVLNTLKRTEIYTFCVLYKEHATVSPYHCFGFEIRDSLPERAWIRNKYSKISMILAGALSLFIVALSVIITYFCIRKHPVLIKGNKRVIIVGKKKPEEPTPPKEYERPVYIPPSILSMLSTAAPSAYGYTRIRRRRYMSPRLRSLSEHSIFSNEVSYIKPAGPSNYQLNTWRLRSKVDPKFVDAVEGTICPPPLPPPNNNIQHLSWEENLYTTL